jgi:ribose/xylose/arabinose/galactoside ABC-type transport system permease subunit
MPPLDGNQGAFAAFWKRHRNEFGLLIAILAVVGFTMFFDSGHSYLEKPWYNAKEVLRHASILGIFAMGAGIVIVSGGIDLSSGSMIALSGAVCASFIIGLVPVDELGYPDTRDVEIWIIVVAITATLGVAFLIGSFHSWLITVLRLPPFIATLASLVGLRSLARVLVQDVNGAFSPTRNTQIYIRDEFFKSLGSTWWIPLVIFVVIAILLLILMSKTVLGRHLYAIGGNEDAARLSGIRTERLKWLAYCIGTVTAAIAGILYASYVGGAMPDRQGLGYELNAIAASVVGGCSLAGGLGTIPGIMLGALFLRVVIDSVSKVVKNNPDEFQGLIVGLLVVLAVTFNELRSKRGGGKQFLPGPLGVVNILVLTVFAGTVGVVVFTEHKMRWGLAFAAVTFALLVVRKIVEVGAARKDRDY